MGSPPLSISLQYLIKELTNRESALESKAVEFKRSLRVCPFYRYTRIASGNGATDREETARWEVTSKTSNEGRESGSTYNISLIAKLS